MIAVLLAALVGPFLVDWTAYRTTFERYGEQLLGHRVAVMGEAEMRLLPTPTLTFSDVRVGEPEDPLLAVQRFEMRIELPPLLKGEVRIIDLAMDRPNLRLSIDEEGRLDWFTARARNGLISEVDPDLVMLEQATIRDGELTMIDARNGQSHKIEDIDLLVTARSMLGPFKLDGMASFQGQRATVVLATGRRDPAGGLRLRAGVTPVSVPVDLVMDGTLTLSDSRPGYEGTYTLASVTPEEEARRAWRSEGGFALDIARLALSGANFRYGPEDRPVTLEGSADLTLAEPYRFDVKAAARQIDLDRIAGRGPAEPLAAAETGLELLAALRGLPHPPIDGSVELAIPAVVSGGGLTQDVLLKADRLASGWRISELSGRMPGRTEFLVRGDLGLQPEPTFRGSFAASVAQPVAFADWWRKDGARGIAAVPFAVESRMDAAGGHVSLTDFAFEIGEDRGQGAISWSAKEGESPVFEADLDAKRIDGDQVGQLARLFLGTEAGLAAGIAGTGTELALRLFAEEVTFGTLSASATRLRASYRDDTLVIDEAQVADLSGARLGAKGRIERLSTAPSGALEVDVDAERLDGVAALAMALAPENRMVRAFAGRPGAFAPARLTLTFQGEASGGSDSAGTQASLVARGTAGGTDVDINLGLDGRLDRWRAASVDFEASFSADEAADLVAQLGVTMLPVGSLGAARVEIGAAGIPEEGLEGHARLYLGPSALTAVGRLTLPESGDSRYAADLAAQAPDLMPLALLTGRLPSLDASAGAVDLAATLEGEGDRFTLSGLSGTFAGLRLDADLRVNLRRALASLDPQVRGTISLSELDISEISDLLLGSDQLAASTGGNWSEAAFGPPVVSGVDLSLDVSAQRMVLAPLPPASNVTARVSMKDDALSLDVGKAGFAGGELTGAYTLKRSAGQAGMTASLRVDGARLEELVWRRAGRPLATGAASINLDIEGSGRSLTGIVSGLTGGGTLRVENGEIRGLNPEAFALVIRAVDAGLDLNDEAIRTAFSSHLDAGVLPFAELEASASIAGGVMRISNARVDNREASIFGNAQADLKALTLQSDFSLRVDPGEEAVTGAEAQVGLVFAGPLAEPQRTIDIAPFTAFLTLRAFEQEVQRVEDLQAEITERDRLMREMRRLREEKRRQERQQQQQDEDAARKLEDERAAEENRKAEEARKKEEARKAEEERRAAERRRSEQQRAEQRRQQQAAPAQTPASQTPAASFGERIRRALDGPASTGTASGNPGAGQPMQLLPPLDPPVFVGPTPDR